MVEATATIWSGDDLDAFLDASKLSPEQVAAGLQRQPLTIRNWIKSGSEPFAGNETDSIVLRLAIIGLVAELKGSKLFAPKAAPPLKLEIYIDSNDHVEGTSQRMVRARRVQGEQRGDRDPIDFAS